MHWNSNTHVPWAVQWRIVECPSMTSLSVGEMTNVGNTTTETFIVAFMASSDEVAMQV